MGLDELLAEAGYGLDWEPADRHSRYRFELLRDGQTVGEGTHFTGTDNILAWIELHLETAVDPHAEQHRELFSAFAAALDPGSHLMVHYLGTETGKALTADVPAPATPLGFLLWQAGCRWFKDWYFTEGWMEGSQKLQGNLPVGEDAKREREAETRDALEAFLASDTEFERCKKLAHEVMDGL